MKKKRLITAALPYVNNLPHLGTLIGCVLSADVFYKYCKIAEHEALYVCGTDEYGTTTETRAKKEGVTPKEICDKYHKLHKEIYDWFEIEFSVFGRTTDQKQTEIVQDIFLKLYNNGYIIEDILVQPYCPECQMFLADRYIEGICPHCAYDKAKGDQCENCGKLLDPSDLNAPLCVTCNSKPEFKKTEHLFFDLKKISKELSEWVDETSRHGWSNNAVKVTKSWIEQGLQKRCITRDLKWGIPVPLEKYKDKVFYVWFDAPIGYISITASADDNWQDWWKNPDEIELYQFIGKDNIPFHTVLFPASLIGTKENWTMLKTISSTEYLNYEDSKFSKSRGIGIFGDQVRETGIDVDLFRYYLLRNRPEKNDTQFYWFDFMDKANGEIIANYANLVNRVLQFVYKFFNGIVPEFDKAFIKKVEFENKVLQIVETFEKVDLKKTLMDILSLCSEGNKFFQDNKPWELIKTDENKCSGIIGNLCGFIKDISILLYPYIPGTVKKVFTTLDLDFDEILLKKIGNYEKLKGKKINKPEVLFKKLERKYIEELKEKYKGNIEKQPDARELFSKLHLKVGKIIEVKKHSEADKLYIEKVDMGNNEVKQIVSGLVPFYKQEELLNKKVILAYNLKPAVLRGIKSEGMLLVAENKDRSIVEVISPDCEVGKDVIIEGAVPNNSEITIDDFFKTPIEIKNYQPVFMGNQLKACGKEIKVEKIKEGKVR